MTYLIFIQVLVDQLVLPLFLEGDDDQGNEDVDEEERKDDEVNHVEYRHFHAVVGRRAPILVGGIHGMFEHSAGRKHLFINIESLLLYIYYFLHSHSQTFAAQLSLTRCLHGMFSEG